MIEQFAVHIQQWVQSMGYPGLFLFVLLESTVVPIPSELILPFAGNLCTGDHAQFTLPLVLLMNSLGALTGSGLSYWFGVKGGRALLLRFGKYILVRPADIERTEQYFARRGRFTVLIARFLPVIRHIISVPAGIARMNLTSFFVQTFIGSAVWGGTLILIGYYLDWQTIGAKLKEVDSLIGVGLILVLVALAARFVLRRRRERATVELSEPSSK